MTRTVGVRLWGLLLVFAGPGACHDAAPTAGAGDDAAAEPDVERAGDAPLADAGADAPSADCIDDPSAGLHRFTCPGTTRPVFTVSVPPQCLAGACGLIVDVHGGTSDADIEDSLTNLRALGEQHGYVVVQPSAVGSGLGTFDTAGGDDDAILAFLEQAIGVWGVDRRRVHMTGFSNGGFMTWRFVCRHADLLASAAPAAAAVGAQYNQQPPNGPLVGCSFTEGDLPSREVDILYMHGRRDECFRFASESPEADSAEDQRDAVLRAWSLGDEQVVGSDAGYTHLRYTNAAGTVLEVLWHDYEKSTQFCPSVWRPADIAGHCIPAPAEALGACNGPTAFLWGEEVIRFFEEHPRD